MAAMQPRSSRFRLLTSTSAIALAAVILGACGSSDSTVSGTPSTEIAPPPGRDRPATSNTSAPAPNGGGFPESPATVPSDAPGLQSPEISARETSFLDTLEDENIETKDLRLELIAAGNGICRIRATGGAASETTTLANAMAGQLVAGGYAKGEPEDVSSTLVDVSIAELCP